MDQYTSIAALVEPVSSGALYPLSGRFLVRLAAGQCPRIERRQDLPKEAFFLATEDIVARNDFSDRVLIALSYRWLTPGHPDRDGFHLKIVAAVLEKHMSWYHLEDVGLFWDFGSLFQNERIGNQQTLFEEGLRASNIWYGSTKSTVWLQPHGSETTPYGRSGWCFVEASISSAIKPSINRLDLGNVGIDVLCTSGGNFYQDITKKCISKRVPPLLPEAVEEKFRNEEVVFTKKGDIGVVSKLYRKFFQDVSSASEELSFRGCQWTDEHIRVLAQSLPFFTNLKFLNLEFNRIGNEGAMILAEYLKENQTLEKLYLDNNHIGSKGKAALGQAMEVRGRAGRAFKVEYDDQETPSPKCCSLM